MPAAISGLCVAIYGGGRESSMSVRQASQLHANHRQPVRLAIHQQFAQKYPPEIGNVAYVAERSSAELSVNSLHDRAYNTALRRDLGIIPNISLFDPVGDDPIGDPLGQVRWLIHAPMLVRGIGQEGLVFYTGAARVRA